VERRSGSNCPWPHKNGEDRNPEEVITQTEATKKWLAVTCACAAWMCGCTTRKTPAKPVVNFIVAVKPVVPEARGGELEAPPHVPMEALPAPTLIGPNRQPAKPRVAAPAAQERTGVDKHREPTIAPEVPTEELKAAQAETRRNLDLAEKNLAMAQGKNLNATQQDIVSKVRGFADNAREAMRSGDWVKAKNLSSKAEVLAEELTASF
jgi:hypothetical protein